MLVKKTPTLRRKVTNKLSEYIEDPVIEFDCLQKNDNVI